LGEVTVIEGGDDDVVEDVEEEVVVVGRTTGADTDAVPFVILLLLTVLPLPPFVIPFTQSAIVLPVIMPLLNWTSIPS
jgi:hypothetical protein